MRITIAHSHIGKWFTFCFMCVRKHWQCWQCWRRVAFCECQWIWQWQATRCGSGWQLPAATRKGRVALKQKANRRLLIIALREVCKGGQGARSANVWALRMSCRKSVVWREYPFGGNEVSKWRNCGNVLLETYYANLRYSSKKRQCN